MLSLLSEPTVTYCEKPINWIIRRPWVGLSNLTYVFLGIFLLTKRDDNIAKIFGYNALFVGILSLIYDISYTFVTQLLDLTMMLIFICTLIYLGSTFIIKNRRLLLTTLLIMLIIAVIAIIYIGDYAGNYIFGIFILIYIIFEGINLTKKNHKGYRHWLFAFGIFLLGICFWFLDVKQIICLEIELLNGRAIFHYLGTISIYFLYKFYSSQDNLKL